MANRNFQTVQALDKGIKELHFKANVSASVLSGFTGLGASGSNTPATGVIKLTLQGQDGVKDSYNDFRSIQCQWLGSGSANVNVHPVVLSADVSSSLATVQIALVNPADGTVYTTGKVGTIMVSAFLKNTSAI